MTRLREVKTLGRELEPAKADDLGLSHRDAKLLGDRVCACATSPHLAPITGAVTMGEHWRTR